MGIDIHVITPYIVFDPLQYHYPIVFLHVVTQFDSVVYYLTTVITVRWYRAH